MGNHPQDKFEKVLDKFIQLYVICPTCKLPEIRIKVKGKNGKVRCASCGYCGPLSTGHRLDNFIIKNPPVKANKNHEMPEEEYKNHDLPKEEHKKEEKEIDEPAEKKENNSFAEEDDQKWSVDSSAEARKKRRDELEANIVVSVAPTTPEEVIKSMIAKYQDTPDMIVIVSSELERLRLFDCVFGVQTFAFLVWLKIMNPRTNSKFFSLVPST